MREDLLLISAQANVMKLFTEILMRTSRNLRRRERSVRFLTVECARKSFLGLGIAKSARLP